MGQQHLGQPPGRTARRPLVPFLDKDAAMMLPPMNVWRSAVVVEGGTKKMHTKISGWKLNWSGVTLCNGWPVSE